MNFGDIYLVDFDPSVGHEFKKIRPAIIVQEKQIFGHSPLVTIIPMTSQIQKQKKYDVYVPRDEKNRLESDSLIKVQQITSYDKSRFIRPIGFANSPTIRKVRGYLRKHFGL